MTITTTKPLVGPASDSQINYLTALLAVVPTHEIVAKFKFAQATNTLSKAQASAWITIMIPLAAHAKTTAKAVPVAVPAPAPRQVQAETLPAVAYGYYVVGDKPIGEGGFLYFFTTKKSPYGGAMMPKLMRLTVKTSYYDNTKKGSWKSVGSSYTAAKVLKGLTPLTLAEAGALGMQMGFCIRCGKTLTDPVSKKNGLGKTCLGYWGGQIEVS